jgi:hypothetical protein
MADHNPPNCERCAGPTRYDGRISMPTQMICRCTACGHQMWMQSNPQIYSAPASEQSQAQQQQQVQPQKEDC